MSSSDSNKYHGHRLQLLLVNNSCLICFVLAAFLTVFVFLVPNEREKITGAVQELDREATQLLLNTKSTLLSPSLAVPTQAEHDGTIALALQDNMEKVHNHLKPKLIPDPPEDVGLNYESLYDILARWNPDVAEVPADFQERLQHFDYGNPYEREMAEKYREQEVPFKVYNVTDFNEVSRKWSDAYLKDNLARTGRTHVEKSKNNHFMFWSYRGLRGNAKNSFTPPTELMNYMTFNDFLPLAYAADEKKLDNGTEHFYFMAGAEANERGRTFISRDLKMFSTQKNNFWITNVAANKGIQCRFGMRGVIAEAHYDSGKNFVAMIRGEKRYILTPPWSCDKLAIITDTKHPSYRHSVIDWSDLEQAKQHNFQEVQGIDTVLRAGEALYIPSFWFHYIISLRYSIQCNSRSGFPKGRKGQDHIKKCFGQS